MDVNNNLRKIRREKDFTQEYMAFELGISQKAYSDIENGKTRISYKNLEKIAYILRVPTSEICSISVNCEIYYKNRYYKILDYIEKQNITLPKDLLD